MSAKSRAGRRCGVIWLLVTILASTMVLAADPHQVKVYLQPASGISDTDPVNLVILVEGELQPNVQAPELHGLTNFEVVGGPSTNRSFKWVNNKSSSSYQLIYTLRAVEPGPAAIPALDVEVSGTTYRTEPIRTTIAAAPQQQPAPTEGDGTRERTRPRDDEIPVVLRAELGTKQAWVGQTVPLTVTLLTATAIAELNWRSTPEFESFWAENVDVDPDLEAYKRRIGSTIYTAHPVVRKLLVPPGPGEFEIEPYVAQMKARGRLRANDPSSVFRATSVRTITRRSDSLRLHVRPLPPDPPEEFDGAVGLYSMRLTLDRQETTVNDAVALRVVIGGEGSLRSIAAPRLETDAGVTLFEPKVTEHYDTSGGNMRSTKSWEWVIVPLTPGEVRLPELRFAFFNPVTESYEVIRAAVRPLIVEPGDSRTDGPLAQGGIQVRRRDLAFIKRAENRLREKGSRAQQGTLFRTLLFLPLVIVPLIIVLGRQRDRLQRDLGLARGRRARARARKRFQALRKRFEQLESAEFHEDLARTLVEYVADRFNRSAAGLTYDLADELLSSKGVEPELRRRFRACMEACDFARFVPSSGQAERRNEVLENAAEIVEGLEASW